MANPYSLLCYTRVPTSREEDGKDVMTFSALGGNVCVWGSQK